MNDEQKKDLENIARQSDNYLRVKYIRGAISHGDLFSLDLHQLILEALDENTDQRVYLLKALEQLEGEND